MNSVVTTIVKTSDATISPTFVVIHPPIVCNEYSGQVFGNGKLRAALEAGIKL